MNTNIKMPLRVAVAAGKAVCSGANSEITCRKLTGLERLVVRGAALNALDNLFYDHLTGAALDQLRNRSSRKGFGSDGRGVFIELCGWGEVL